MNPPTSTPSLVPSYFDACPVCGVRHSDPCRDPYGRRIKQTHKARYDAKAREDFLAWRRLGARQTG